MWATSAGWTSRLVLVALRLVVVRLSSCRRQISKKIPTVLLVPLTTQRDALRLPGTVLVEPDADNGLRQPSIALVFQLAVLNQRFLGKQLGRVSPVVLQAVWTAFDEITERTKPK